MHVSATGPSVSDAFRDHYQVEREIGRAGMATVYLARDLKHNRPVALKVLHPDLAATLGPERFLREIQIAANLNHPHILPLHDSGAAGGLLYYVMPYVEGESLRDRLMREKQLSIEDALRLGREVGQALDYAHRHGVVHRDIKPENILLEEGEAMVADFGIAHAISEAGETRLTATGLTLGTPVYMSPEQAAGERNLDGRSDLYSLGCVLYEMLVGQPPFTGATAQAIMARRLYDPVPSLRVVRDTVPAVVEQAITKALARVPADRFATASEFVNALSLSPRARAGVVREGNWRRSITPVAALVLVAVLGAVLVRWRPTAPSLDSNLIAVAPFDVAASPLRPWSEGLVDVLARSLDGTGPLRTVAPTVILKHWTGRADPASAGALGRATGAGLVVFGSLDRSGGDSVRIRAAALDVGAGDVRVEVEVRGDTLRMDRLVDSLAVALLRELGRTQPVGAVGQSPLDARSLPALKAFLKGEQFYRRGVWDSALSQYDRAIALDSAFALAYRRMGLVLSWRSPSAATFKPVEDYIRQAAALNQGLSPRDSLLILGDSLMMAVVYDALSDARGLRYFGSRRRLFATLEEARRRYPGDPEVWQALGEARFHVEDPSIATPEDALDAFDRAIALDSAFAPAYFHTPGLAIAIDLGDPGRARRYLSAYLRLNPKDDNAGALRLTARLLDPSLADLPETASLIDTVSAGVLLDTGLEYLTGWPDSAETAVRLLRSLAFRARISPSLAEWQADSANRGRMLAFALAGRGRLREAHQLYPTLVPAWEELYVQIALLGGAPADTVSAVLHQALEHHDPERVIAAAPALPWWFAHRDTIALARFASRMDSIAHRETSRPVASAMRHYVAAAATAYLALARGDSNAAISGFAALGDSVCGLWLRICPAQRLTEARLLEAIGEEKRASELLQRWAGLDPLALLQRARLAENLGDREKAIRSYQFVADVWHHADPELRPYLAEARSGLARLTSEPRDQK